MRKMGQIQQQASAGLNIPRKNQDTRTNRNLARNVDLSEFCRYLFEALYSAKDGYRNTYDLVRKIFQISLKEDPRTGEKRGIDAVKFSWDHGYECFEKFLESKELSQIVNVREEVYACEEEKNRPYPIKIYCYAYGPMFELYNSDHEMKYRLQYLKKNRFECVNSKYAQGYGLPIGQDLMDLEEDRQSQSSRMSRMTKELKGELISYEVDVDDDEGTNFDENESSVGGINFDQDIKDYIDEELDDQKNDYGKYFCGDTDFSETTKILMDEIDELKKGAKKSAEKPSTE